ncbi:lipocalin family protein [Polaribacter uvawellassae]|uniref:lipocalin family protein n=1 Tax=Polaribacter uvawellassae TaxID=3133495 RepID=UPI0032191476
MKTKILMVAIALIFISCSSSKEESTDPVVGIWKLNSITMLGQEFINNCKLKDNIEIRSNKTFTITSHNLDDNCAIETASGNWVSVSNDKYNFSAAGDTQTFTLVSDNMLTFSFVQNSNTVVYTYIK